MKRDYFRVIHPFLFGSYSVIALLAFNLNEVFPTEGLRSLLIVLAVTAVLYLFFSLLFKNGDKAGLLVSLYWLLFFSHGHIVEVWRNSLQPDSIISGFDVARYLTALWAAFFIVGTWGIWRLIKRDIKTLTTVLNVTAAIAIALPTYNVFAYLANLDTSSPQPTEPSLTTTISSQQLPDIYFILMDGYTSEAVLAEVFDYDNSELVTFLQQKGFFVANNSFSNYNQTRLSLAATLNYDYVDNLLTDIDTESADKRPLRELIQTNKVEAFLHDLGYKTVAISSGFNATELKTADVFIAPDATVINEFESMLLINSIVGTVLESNLRFEEKRGRVNFVFDAIPQAVSVPGPKFVFVHILAPHWPMVFGPNGEKLSPITHPNPNSAEAIELWFQSYLQRYPGEVTYLNQRLQEAVTQILDESSQPPIILIQGDHGSRAYLNFSSATDSCVRERFGILSAYYLPDNGVNQLYDSISSVNSFRIILDTYFGTNLGLLDDTSYFATWDHTYDFIDVTNRLDQLCPAP
jgi:hypothetical protein